MAFKVAVIGNCQARPISVLLKRMRKDVEIVSVGIVHLLNDSEQERYIPYLQSSDLIVAQLVTPNYPCNFVTTDSLRKHYGERVLSIVNLYYLGYNPELVYVRLPEGMLRGPLGDYHLKTIIEGWRDGLPAQEIIARLTSFEFNLERFKGASQHSIKELHWRERQVDVPICDFIEMNWPIMQLFHTMNHPCNILLEEYTRRILKTSGLPGSTTKSGQQEMLGQFQLPVNPYVTGECNFQFDGNHQYKGLASIDKSDVTRGFKGVREYSALELVTIFISLYEANSEGLRKWLTRQCAQ